MTLDDFMIKNNITNKSLADDLKVTDSFISKLRHGLVMPSLPVALMISRFCSGKVTIVDLVSESKLNQKMLKRGARLFTLKDLKKMTTTLHTQKKQ